MIYLLGVSFVWAFSFGLIKGQLTGLDPNMVAMLRMVLSLLVFAPFFRIRSLGVPAALRLVLIGAVQYGLMYMAYIASFQYLQAYQVALFTIFTPLYVTLINDILELQFHPLFLGTAALTVFGTGVIVYRDIASHELQLGFALLQGANLCFAAGQIAYKRLRATNPDLGDLQVYALLYLGASLTTAAGALYSTSWMSFTLTGSQAVTLLYLGVLASGVCFFLWNYGATKVNTGALAICNNLKIPLAIACSALFFHESVGLMRLLSGGAIIGGALVFNEWMLKRSPAPQGRS